MRYFLFIFFLINCFSIAQNKKFSPAEIINSPEIINTSALYSGSQKALESQKLASGKLPVEIKLKKSGIIFRLIPAGKFLMGSPRSEKGRAKDETIKSVSVSNSFYMGKFEISQKQWALVMGDNPSYFKQDEKLPVENITWAESLIFVSKLEALEGLKIGALNIPDEKEWEYACRAGTMSPFYSGSTSQDLSKIAWFYNNSGTESLAGKKFSPTLLKTNKNQTKLPGQKYPNAFGLYDMHGNVWEWCRDIYSYKNNTRVLRGGGWNISPSFCRAAARRFNGVEKRHPSIGLRLMLKADYIPETESNFQDEIELSKAWPEVFQNRSIENKAKAIAKYGISPQNQESVLKALRWLKSVQKPDGSWGSSRKSAITSLALLTFLANGYVHPSGEFGPCVNKAINWIAKAPINIKESHAYPHAIKTIALAESYGLTNSAQAKLTFTNSINEILKGLRPEGSFDYNYKLDSNRNDLSFSAWNYKALNSAIHINHDLPKVLPAIEKCLIWLKSATTGEYQFPYSTDGKSFKTYEARHTMRAAGTMCLQMFGGGNFSDLKDDIKTIALSDVLNIRWTNPIRECLYGWFYASQAMFNTGGDFWKNWNNRIQTLLSSVQNEDGYWTYPGQYHGNTVGDETTQRVYATSLCVLILSTPYRFKKK